MSESVIGIGKAKVEVRTGKYRTAFAPRDNQSAANQIAMLQSMLVERDARLAAAEAEHLTDALVQEQLQRELAAAEAALARIALSETGDKCWSDFAQDFLGWKSISELWDIIKAAKAGGGV